MRTPKRRTADGFELQIGTSQLGCFAPTNLLLHHVTDRVVGAVVDLAQVPAWSPDPPEVEAEIVRLRQELLAATLAFHDLVDRGL